jgi:hypothetical protein
VVARPPEQAGSDSEWNTTWRLRNWLPGPAPFLADPQGQIQVYPKEYPEKVYPLYVAKPFQEPKFVRDSAQG